VDPQWFQCGSGSQFVFQLEKTYFFFKITVYFSLGLHEGRLSYKEKPPALKREHPAFENNTFLYFFLFTFESFCPPGSGSSRPKSMGNYVDLDADPQHQLSANVFYNFSCCNSCHISGEGEGGGGIILGEISKSLQAIYAEGGRGGGDFCNWLEI
jgi:hypothetical protein